MTNKEKAQKLREVRNKLIELCPSQNLPEINILVDFLRDEAVNLSTEEVQGGKIRG